MPAEPESGACCNSGCDPCVFDLYWEAVDRYEQTLAQWKARHPSS
ncbi:MAG: oxidoreductase-like domain-containing protein [Burkholderiales bacterium]